MKTPTEMKTPEQIYHELCDKHIETLDREKIVVMAILAYHDQFTITPSERERQIAIAFAVYCPDEQGGMGQIFDSFTQSDAYKTIPPIDTPDKLNGWIPVSERLPEYYEVVMSYSTDERLFHPIVFVWRASDGDTDSYTVYGKNIIVNITHWQPLPAPPKPEKQ